jgi:hypothetical protein
MKNEILSAPEMFSLIQMSSGVDLIAIQNKLQSIPHMQDGRQQVGT